MMPGMWMPMCGQTWLAAAGSFVGMWSVMMVAMMLPACVPMLWRYRAAVRGAGEARRALLTLLAGAGYFVVWLLAGVAVFPLGAALSTVEMQTPALARAVPFAAAWVVVIAGALQFTAWKAQRLACCRAVPGCGRALSADAGSALRHGVRLGLRCGSCCGNLMLALLAVGVMDLWAMAAVTVAIAAERVAPVRGRRVMVRAIGVAAVGMGVAMLAQAMGV